MKLSENQRQLFLAISVRLSSVPVTDKSKIKQKAKKSRQQHQLTLAE